MGAEGDVGGGSGKTLQSHGQLSPGKMRIGTGVELGSARRRKLLGECHPKRTAMSTSFFESGRVAEAINPKMNLGAARFCVCGFRVTHMHSASDLDWVFWFPWRLA